MFTPFFFTPLRIRLTALEKDAAIEYEDELKKAKGEVETLKAKLNQARDQRRRYIVSDCVHPDPTLAFPLTKVTGVFG